MVTQFCLSPQRVVEFCAGLARQWPDLPVYVGIAGPTDPIALQKLESLMEQVGASVYAGAPE